MTVLLPSELSTRHPLRSAPSVSTPRVESTSPVWDADDEAAASELGVPDVAESRARLSLQPVSKIEISAHDSDAAMITARLRARPVTERADVRDTLRQATRWLRTMQPEKR